MSDTILTDAPARHLLAWDSLELWTGNARAMSGFLMSAFGFRCRAYAGPETGVRDRASYVLEQGDVRLIVTGALDPASPIARYVREHGDGVHDLAWSVDDARAAFDAAVRRGATPVREPYAERDGNGTIERATVAAYGETLHTFVDRTNYANELWFAPSYSEDDALPDPDGPTVGSRRSTTSSATCPRASSLGGSRSTRT